MRSSSRGRGTVPARVDVARPPRERASRSAARIASAPPPSAPRLARPETMRRRPHPFVFVMRPSAPVAATAVGAALAVLPLRAQSPGAAPAASTGSHAPAAALPTPPLRFAVIGDYGLENAEAAAVAALVHAWNPA